jgi:hypothetical protein
MLDLGGGYTKANEQETRVTFFAPSRFSPSRKGEQRKQQPDANVNPGNVTL